MHYLRVEGLKKVFGIQTLFQNLSLSMSEGDKIALIARNGTGKSTLLKIISNQETYDEGIVWTHKNLKITFLSQQESYQANSTILDNLFDIENDIVKVYKNYEKALFDDDIEKQMALLPIMDDLGAWNLEQKIDQIATKLELGALNQTIGTLSGGQKKRLALAKLLIDIGLDERHNLLIMDEPTNHLDIEMVEWLTAFLNKQQVSLLLVTHDRYFLDDVSNKIWELDNETLYEYKGDYANYIEKKAERIASELSSIDKAKNLYKKELDWMRRQPKARTTKSKSRISSFYDTEEIAKKKIAYQSMKLEQKMNRLGGKIAEFKKVYHAYGDKKILNAFDYTFKKGERVGVIGKNGTGKTTFLKLLQQIELPNSGKINLGETVIFGHFSQSGLEIKEDKRVIEFVKDIAESFPLAKGGSLNATQFLTLFLFTPEKQFTYISKLSGGEKKRLLLLTILFKNPNFLILDEPTNDLDLPTLQVLEDFLLQFQGCLILVSHDRYFMDKLVDHLLVFEGDGIVSDFPGTYTEFLERKTKPEPVKQVLEPIVIKEEKSIPQKSKLTFNEKRTLEILEKELENLHQEKAILISKLELQSDDFEAINSMSIAIQNLDSLIENKESDWLILSEKEN